MSHTALSALIARAGRPAAPVPATDGALLTRFVRTRDAAAFAELVRRLGPMVLGVCRRGTRDAHLADDAFQATFVVLARRAGAVRPAEAVRAWLYGVAVRTAQEARTMSARRRTREVPVAQVPDRPAHGAEPADADALRALDEEIAALPDHLRAAVVLCELDGLSRRDAATRLGIAAGTLSSRLAKARKLLADRLRKRGVTAIALAALGHATVSPRLLAQTSALASGTAVPAAVVALTKGVFRSTLLARLKTSPLVAFGVGLLGWAALAAPADPPAPERPAPPAVAVTGPTEPAPPPPRLADPLPKGPNRILIRRGFSAVSEQGLYLIAPDGTDEKRVSEKESKFTVSGATLSPDCRHLAALVHGNQKPGDDRERSYLHVRALDEKEPGMDLRVAPDFCVWSADGTELACTEFEDHGDDKPLGSTHYIVNVKTKAKSALKLPSGHVITGWSPDGKHFLTEHKEIVPKPFGRLYLLARDGSVQTALTGEKERAVCGRLSPDGGRVLYAVGTGPTARHDMYLLDIASKKVTKVEDLPLNAMLIDFCWAPDGKRIAYVWRRFNAADTDEDAADKDTEAHLIVSAPDGTNAKTVLTEKCTGRGAALSEVNWR